MSNSEEQGIYLITGATGNVGRHLVKELIEHDHHVRALTRNPQKANFSDQVEVVTEEVISWPGIKAGLGKRDEYAFKIGRREIGHLHGNRVAHFGFPKEVSADLRNQGRVEPHPVKPDSPKLASRIIKNEV